MYGDNADASLEQGSSVTLPDAVSAGDSINATVSYSSGQWTLAIADLGPEHTWSYSLPVVWDASSSASPDQLSAEWVVERPELCSSSCTLTSLTNFGTASFRNASATKSGTTKSLSALSPFALQMSVTSPSSLLALPASLAPGANGFSDTFYHSG
jgi:subtilisin-like proprotein convertase family protein